MKKKSSAILLFALVAISSLGSLSCKKTFDGVTAILSNNYIKQRVSVQIINANPKATTPYPANTVLTLSGTGIDQGLIYNDAGSILTNAVGSAKAISNTVTLVVKPYTTIQAGAPISFTIMAEAPGYLSASKTIVITSLDSMQYVDVKMVQIASLPDGVAVTNNVPVGNALGGSVNVADTVNLFIGGNKPANKEADVIFPLNTVLKDANNNPIKADGPMTITASSYNSSSSDAVQIVPGGLFDVTTTTGESISFTFGAAIDMNVSLGGTEVKNFSTPLPTELMLPATTFNENTGKSIKLGDQIEIWSNDGRNWKFETMANIISNGIGGLEVKFYITHLSTWMAGNKSLMCANDTKITFTGPASLYYIELKASSADGGQFLAGEAVTLKDVDEIVQKFPAGMNYTIKLYPGSYATGAPVVSLDVSACSPSAAMNYVPTTTNPELLFNLETKCNNGLFKYTGGIDYRLKDAALWSRFTPASNGTLITTLLEWDKTYDFRIAYNGNTYQRTRQVLKAEFRNTAGNLWNYWGRDAATQQTNFVAPIECK